MASLVHRIQAALLGSAGHEQVHELLRELAIPANQPRQPDAFERCRRYILYDAGATTEQLRSALADLGLSGGGGGDAR